MFYRHALLILCCISYSLCNNTTFQLISFNIISDGSSKDRYALMNTGVMTNFTISYNTSSIVTTMNVQTSGDYRADGFHIIPTDGNTTIVNAEWVQWSLEYTDSFPDFDDQTFHTNLTGLMINVGYTCKMTAGFVPKGPFNQVLTKRKTVNMEWTAAVTSPNMTSTASFPKTSYVDIRYFIVETSVVTQQTTTVKKGNKAAVAAAVIEGIILFILLLFLLYWLFIVRPKQRAMAAFGTGFPGNDPYATNRNIGGGASAGPPGYGYNQNQSPIRVEMQDRTPPSSTTPAPRPAGALDSDRVQTSHPDLVAVPRNNADPFSQW